MNLSKFAVRRPVAITVFVIITIMFGLIAMQRIGIDLLPNLSFPYAVVVTVYPGGAAQSVEQGVTIPVERSLSGISGLRRQESYSMEDISAVILQFDWGTDLLTALEQIRNNLAQVALSLPEGAQAPIVVQIDPNAFPLMLIGASSNDLSPVELTDELRKITPQLEQLNGVAQVSLFGTSNEEVQVLFDPDYLNDIGLTPVVLQQLIMYQNIVVPGGAVTADGIRYTTRAGSQINSVEELENIIVGMKQGSGLLGLGGLLPSLTYLSDVAEVTTHVEPRNGVTRHNGQDAVLLQVMGQSGANTVRVAEDLKETLEQLEIDHPHLHFTRITDQSVFINQSIGSLASSGIIGGILAIAVLWIFLRSVPSLLIVGLSIPVSVIASFVLLYFSNLSLNLMTLGGMALGVGMLVDSSIVVLENVYRHLSLQPNVRLASQQGAGEIAGALIASTATSIVVFLPIIFLDSFAGQLLKEFGLSISYALLASLVVSLTLLPVLASKFLKKSMVTASGEADSKFVKSRSGYASLLNKSLEKKGVVFALVVVLLIVALVVYPTLDQEFLPSFDEGFLGVHAMLPTGVPLEETRELIIALENDLLAIPEVETVAVQSGDQGELDVLSLLTGTGLENAMFSITLVPHGERQRSGKDLTEEIHNIMANHGVVRANISDTSLFGSAASTLMTPNLTIDIRGEDLEVLNSLSQELMAELRKVSGFRDIQDSTDRPTLDLYLNVDTSRSILGGFTAGQVGLGMRYATAGLKATDLQVGDRVLPVVLRPSSAIDSVEDLMNTRITSPVQIDGLGGEPILLSQVVTPEVQEIRALSQRVDRLNVTRVFGTLGEGLSLTQAARHSEEIIDRMEFPPGYHATIGGLQTMIGESIEDLVLALVLAVALVFLVMAAQFESFLQPVIIMFTIPLALIGALAGLWLVDGNLGIMSIIGIIVLVGIVVNNAIVLIDYINLRRRQNPTTAVREAILEACQVRLRPILMTTITTVFGLLPVVLARGVGAEFQRPLAATIMGGLITSTFLTLFVIPTVYEVFSRFERKPKPEVNVVD
ncbi:MAG TPA: efflux RND transporter permease subunit [Limnochordia bacterium]|nr:efflux RND transporter permease subunit [Limnochordia bacterium]